MKNVYDIRYEKALSYIIPTREVNIDVKDCDNLYEDAAVILYFYYADTAGDYFKYIDNIPEKVKLCIISSRKEVLDIFRAYIDKKQRKNTVFRLKENRGRDISALLVTAKDIILQHKYVCFVHDKKEHVPEMREETLFWIENLWGNMLGSATYIIKILQTFMENSELGMLASPDPIGKHFCTWYGYGWHGAFNITRELSVQLNLCADLNESKPPITLGTVLWFRVEALRKLFEWDWKYENFDDEQLQNPNYLSYGIERIFPYVAQDAGYDTGEVMTLEYAQKQNNYLHYTTARIFATMQPFCPLPSVHAIECYERNYPRLLDYAGRKARVFLYGAGDMGRFCLTVLRREGIEPSGFVVTDKGKVDKVDGIPVISVHDLMDLDRVNTGLVITVTNVDAKQQIANMLKKLGIGDYMIFWLQEGVQDEHNSN